MARWNGRKATAESKAKHRPTASARDNHQILEQAPGQRQCERQILFEAANVVFAPDVADLRLSKEPAVGDFDGLKSRFGQQAIQPLCTKVILLVALDHGLACRLFLDAERLVAVRIGGDLPPFETKQGAQRTVIVERQYSRAAIQGRNFVGVKYPAGTQYA